MDDVQGADVLAELRELRLRVAELEGRAAADEPAEERSTRRGMLRLAGAAVVGGAAASLAGAQPAAAAVGFMRFGESNDATTDSTSLSSSQGGTTLGVSNANAGGVALQGTATSNGTGVLGFVTSPGSSGFAVKGFVSGSTNGYALVGDGGKAQLFLDPAAGTAAPGSGAHLRGEVVSNAGGFFLCVADGTPGTWRKLGGPATAGAFHAITPTRVYDSRAAAPQQGILATGQLRTISVADGRNNSGAVVSPNIVPAGATAVAANVTVTGTTGSFGYLAINPGGNVVEGASTINWFGAGQTLANGVGLTLNGSRQITVICNGGGSTHFIIDIAGYYL